MPVRKTAVSIPEKVLAEVDRAAAERGESRSGYITRILKEAVRSRRDAEISRRLNELFADEELQKEQLRMTEERFTAEVDWREDGW